ncbi:relaxase/mobilization nuclease domain-containing protein [[Ruminococcus] torques]|uniref:relaxase/mobilization nuclease domain-containing protein n=1 Tax=[Ruminococcus] torques TaxID=33039 RepID=UPI0012BBF856|nr:relaxase/mobilization nuclease domain-containing protein [[Ruminococcus] torques]MTQ74476.1 relaxase/mobilization nuclease domain-containing protein [[Ruminococcus] torques]MTQ78848.1 relaxase/mobilization nuclease domain-containing protein [[Ruminococcus] torques]MTQ85096.1 relaxase/mobilization nuclease domain-containing protein [[Ruminococcus] torques]MTR59611.1 relaxase/mobilization nuclease domain-containing protein [[Ruminococcus] torques]MTS76076.1 relaxase/mobilization nuclease doma
MSKPDNEYCKEDKTHRYAVHIVINRSDLSTGKRLDEGRGKEAKVRRASRIRKMDKAWGLKQVERDERNSSVHKKQPSKVEKEIEGRGGKSYKTNLRELCRIAAERSQDIYEYREMLEGWGVDTQFRKGRLYVTDTDNSRYSFSLAKLDADLNQNGLNRTFRANVVADIREKGRQAHEERVAVEAERQRVTGIRDAYLEDMRRSYLDYRKKVHGLEGTALVAFPKLELKRPPKEVVDDPEVKRLFAILRFRYEGRVSGGRASDAHPCAGGQLGRVPVQCQLTIGGGGYERVHLEALPLLRE